MSIDRDTAERAFNLYAKSKKANWADVRRELGLVKVNNLALFNSVKRHGFLDLPEDQERCVDCKEAKHLREFAFISVDSEAGPMCSSCVDELSDANRASLRVTRGLAWNDPLAALLTKQWDERQRIRVST